MLASNLDIVLKGAKNHRHGRATWNRVRPDCGVLTKPGGLPRIGMVSHRELTFPFLNQLQLLLRIA